MQKQVCVDFFSIRFAVNDQFLTPESLIEEEFIFSSNILVLHCSRSAVELTGSVWMDR